MEGQWLDDEKEKSLEASHVKASKFREGLKQRQQQFDSSGKHPQQGYCRPGSLSGPGPMTKERYRRGIATKRSQQAAAKRGVA